MNEKLEKAQLKLSQVRDIYLKIRSWNNMVVVITFVMFAILFVELIRVPLRYMKWIYIIWFCQLAAPMIGMNITGRKILKTTDIMIFSMYAVEKYSFKNSFKMHDLDSFAANYRRLVWIRQLSFAFLDFTFILSFLAYMLSPILLQQNAHCFELLLITALFIIL